MSKSKTLPVFLMLITLMIIMSLGSKVSLADSDTSPYIIGPSDVLEIFIWKEPELSRDVIVMSDGRITYPLIGDVLVKGLTVKKLREIMTEKLGKYVEAPEVTVIIKESRSRRIYTLGKLNKPGPLHLGADMTVIQALSLAGGFAEWADTKRILIIRRGGKKETQLHFNYKDFISGKNVGQNVVLMPNDTILVP